MSCGMVALVGHVPHNCGYVGTHADNTCAGLALAVPSSNCIVAHPHLILDCGTVPTLNFSAKLAWPLLQNKYLKMAVVQMLLGPVAACRRQMSAHAAMRRPAVARLVKRQNPT